MMVLWSSVQLNYKNKIKEINYLDRIEKYNFEELDNKVIANAGIVKIEDE